MKTFERLGLGGMTFMSRRPLSSTRPRLGLRQLTAVLGLGVPEPRGLQSSADDRREVPATAQAVVVEDGVLEVDVVLPGAVAADGDAAELRGIDAKGHVGRVVGQGEVDEEVLARAEVRQFSAHCFNPTCIRSLAAA